MNCDEARKLMDGYLDGELDPVTSQKVDQHLRDCRKCEQAYEVDTVLAHAISQAAPYYKAPTELRERIHASLRDAISASTIADTARENQLLARSTKPEHRNIFSELPWNWLGLAAAIILAAAIVSTLLPRMRAPAPDQFLATQLIASHVRSLMANHLTDVASSDQHTVKPWLDAKLDFAPPVVDLASEGFPLIGGRLDYLDNRPVAALVYQRRKHFINVFVWPGEAAAARPAMAMSHQGYQLLHWADPDFNYWAVSDVSANDLQSFKQQFAAQTPHH
jgi:mycothiol system anti-sigma-R factor